MDGNEHQTVTAEPALKSSFLSGLHDFMAKGGKSSYSAVIAFLLVMNLGLISIVILLGSALAAALPLQKEVPYLVQYAPDNLTMVGVTRLNTDNDRIEIIAKRLASDYVRIRNEIIPDKEEMDRRWGTKCLQNVNLDSAFCGYIFSHSVLPVYEDFQGEIKFSEDTIQRFIAEGRTRRIEFGNNEPKLRNTYKNAIGGAPAFDFEIDFVMIDSVYDPVDRQNRDLHRQAFTVLIQCALIGQENQNPYEKYINPFAFKVNKHRMSRRDSL